MLSRDWLLQRRQCCKHSTCVLPTGDADISGSHCNDHSTAGLQQGRHGETAKYFLAHCKYLKEKQVKIVMLENVKAKEFESLVCIPQLFTWEVFFFKVGLIGDDKLPRYIGDNFIRHYKDPVLKQPVFHGT